MKTFNPDEPLEFSLLADIEQTRAFTQDRVPEEDQINEEDLCLPSKIEMASNLLRSIKNAGKKINEIKIIPVKNNIENKEFLIIFVKS